MGIVSVIVGFLLLFCLIITAVQNNAPLQIKFIAWGMEMSLASVIFWAAVAGAAIVSVLSLPKLAGKSLQTRRLRKEVRRLEGLCAQPRVQPKEEG